MKTLYTEQAEGTDLLLSDVEQRWRLVVMPTGAGKTAVLQTAATVAALRGKKVIIATPLQVIRSAIQAPDTFVYRDEIVSTNQAEWVEVTGGSELLARLRSDRPGGFVMVVTQQLFAQALDVFPKDMSDWAIVLDEAHHSGEAFDLNNFDRDGTQVFRGARLCLERGGQVWGVTATAFRADGRRVHMRDVATYMVRYSDLALRSILPRNVRVRTSMCPDADERILANHTLQHIAIYIRAEGRPTVIRIPPGSGASEPAALTAERMVAALIGAGYSADRILNVVGTGDEFSERLLTELNGERERAAAEGYSGRKYDIILACGRMKEGADWPYCSHVVLVGIPTSLTAAVQFAGRGSRNKHRIAGYPTEWVEDVLVSGFIPGRIDPLEVASQAKRALILAAAIECDETVLDYRRFWSALVAGFRLPPLVRMHAGTAKARLLGSVEEQAVADATVIAARQDFKDTLGRDPSPAELWGKLDQWGTAGETAVRRSLLAGAVVKLASDPKLQAQFGKKFGVALDSASSAEGIEAWEKVFEDTLAVGFASLAAEFSDIAIQGMWSGFYGIEARLSPEVFRAATQALAQERNTALTYSDVEIVKALPDPRTFPRIGHEAPLSHYFGRRTFASDLQSHLNRTGFDLDRLRLCNLWAQRKACIHPVVGELLDPSVVRATLLRLRKTRSAAFRSLADVAKSARAAEDAFDKGKTFTVQIAGQKESLIGLYWGAQRGWRGLTADVFAGLLD